MPGELYNEMQRELQFQYDVNSSLDRKAQNLMIATALAAAQFITLAAASKVGWLDQYPVWQSGAFIFLVGMIITTALCIFVNRERPHPLPSPKEKILRSDKFDDKAYRRLIAVDGNDYCKLRIKEYSLTAAEQERINKKKAKLLNAAYSAFVICIIAVIPALVVGFKIP